MKSQQPAREGKMETVMAPSAILIVDDDDSVRDVFVSITETALPGVEVFQAAHGIAALEVLKQHGAKIKVMFSDVNMPVMDGPKTVKVVKREYPHVRTILASGRGKPHGHEADVFLEKPVSYEVFLAVIRGFLNPQ